MMVCLDSDVIIDFLRNENYAVKKIEKFQAEGRTISTTSINEFELLKGAMRSNQENAMGIVSGFLNNIKILNFDSDSGKKAAGIFEALRKKGEVVDVLDLMIASISISNNETFLTRNIKHFARISELKLES